MSEESAQSVTSRQMDDAWLLRRLEAAEAALDAWVYGSKMRKALPTIEFIYKLETWQKVFSDG